MLDGLIALYEELGRMLSEADVLNTEMMSSELQRIILDQIEKEEEECPAADGSESSFDTWKASWYEEGEADVDLHGNDDEHHKQVQARAVLRQAVGDNTQLIERVVEKLRITALKAEELRVALSEHQKLISTEFLSSPWQVRNGEEPVVFGDEGISV